MSKPYSEISKMAEYFELNSEDPVVSQTRWILNMILGYGPGDMMQDEGQINFLHKCANGILGEAEGRREAAQNVYTMLFGNN